MRTNLELRFDGGCKGNPGDRYGSYVIFKDGVQIAVDRRFELGHGTNNEAEWLALIAGLAKVVAGSMGKGCRMWVLSLNAWRMLDLLGGFEVVWRGREGNVRDFGH